MAALTSDIFWLETQTTTLPDGSTTQAVLPRVCLLPRAGDLAANGALIAGRYVKEFRHLLDDGYQLIEQSGGFCRVV